MVLLIYTVGFLAAVVLTIAIYNLVFAGRLEVAGRIKQLNKSKEVVMLEERKKSEGTRRQFISALGTLGRVLSRKGPYMEKVRLKLLYARWMVRPDEFIGLKLFMGVAGGAVLGLLMTSILFGMGGAVLGFVVPDFVLNVRAKQRMHRLTMQLPEALTIIANGLRAGLGFYQALSVVTRDMEPPIQEEFNQVIFENSMGKPTEEVLLNLKERTDSEDLDILIAALLIQKQVGGSLAEILDNIAHTIRERVRIKGEIRTLTSQGRLSALIICLLPIFVGVLIYTLNPEYIGLLFTNLVGQIMLLMAGLMMVVGVLFVRKIVDIEV